MSIAPLITGIIAVSAVATSALAEPYCPEMLNRDELEPRYQRLAPIYNSAETGWIFGSDQLDYRYVLTNTEQTLLADLVSELASRGTQLSMLIAPPRPVVAGQEVVDETTGQAGSYDMAAQANAFHHMIGQLKQAGAVAPDLLALAQSQPSLANTYYFQRDTHWTNLSAAYSALALASELSGDPEPAFDPSSLAQIELVEEPGSLSEIVSVVCDTTPGSEFSALLDYSPHLPQMGGLLETPTDAGDAAILLGTSFSDRNRRDQYQTADALDAALQRPIQNRSVSGGGLVGPFETYILTGGFAEDRPDLVIWEFPYTYELRERELRRLLGALRADEGVAHTQSFAIGGDTTQIDMPNNAVSTTLLGLRMTDGSARDMILHLHFDDGSDAQFRLRRKTRMDEVAILDTWWIDLHDFPAPLASITLELRGNSDLRELQLLTADASS